jgi:hypothetical protein
MGDVIIFGHGVGDNAASDGSEDSHIPSLPPTGLCAVTNLYVDPETGKLVVEYQDIPIP